MNEEMKELISKWLQINGDGNVVGTNNNVSVVKQSAGDYAIQIASMKIDVTLSAKEIRDLFPNFSRPQPIPWGKVRVACQEESQCHLSLLENKYDADLYVNRSILKAHIDEFLENQNTYYLVLLGRSGMGKTAFLYNLQNSLRSDPDIACLIYDSGALKVSGQSSKISILNNLAEDISINSDGSWRSLLQRIELHPDFDKQRLVIIVDAINESKNLNAIIEMLADLQLTKTRSWIKTIVSCRPHIWNRMSHMMTASRSAGGYKISPKYFYHPRNTNEPYVQVPGFTETELIEAYEKFQNMYNFSPKRYQDLPPVLQSRLREPLLLTLVAEVCQDKEITVAKAGSDIQLIPEYTHKILSKDIYSDKAIEGLVDFVEKLIPEKMVIDGRCFNTVSLEALNLGDDSVINGLNRFLESGILEEIGDGRIRFRFERFYDYYFGVYLRSLARQGILLDCSPEDPSDSNSLGG